MGSLKRGRANGILRRDPKRLREAPDNKPNRARLGRAPFYVGSLRTLGPRLSQVDIDGEALAVLVHGGLLGRVPRDPAA